MFEGSLRHPQNDSLIGKASKRLHQIRHFYFATKPRKLLLANPARHPENTQCSKDLYAILKTLPSLSKLSWQKRGVLFPALKLPRNNPIDNTKVPRFRTGGLSHQTSCCLSKIEPVEVHHLVPCCHKVAHELFLRILAGVYFRQSAQDRI